MHPLQAVCRASAPAVGSSRTGWMALTCSVCMPADTVVAVPGKTRANGGGSNLARNMARQAADQAAAAGRRLLQLLV